MLKFMKSEALKVLRDDVENNIEKYTLDEKWLDSFFEEKGMGDYSFNTGIHIELPELINGDSENDAENAIRIHSALKDLNPVQASDLRLWAYMTHNTYWEYMKSRWPVAEGEKGKVYDRYFFGQKWVSRSGIARLWWAAYFTYDENNSDPYEYTRYVFSKQDLLEQTVGGHALCRHKNLMLASLKEIRKVENIKRQEIRDIYKKLNQIGGLIMIDALDEADSEEIVKRTIDEVLERQVSLA